MTSRRLGGTGSNGPLPRPAAPVTDGRSRSGWTHGRTWGPPGVPWTKREPRERTALALPPAVPMPHPHADLIHRFYDAFARRDAAAMRACYQPEADFRDEVFALHGPRVGAMWTMLTEAGDDLRVTHSSVTADAASGSAHWEAAYTFGATGRPVHNVVEAGFTFEDGLIRTHTDRFDFWAWSRQALGLPGALLGWTPFLRSKVRSEAARRLDRYVERHPEALTT